MQHVILLGHGGVKGPHMNTISAFKQALAQGAHGFEVDVRDTADARLVALHDPSFEAQGRTYRVSDLTLPQLRRIHPRGEELATLDEALAQLPNALVDVDAKTPRAARLAAALVEEEGYTWRTLLSADTREILTAARKASHNLRLGYSVTSLRGLAALPLAALTGLYSVHAPLDGIQVLGLRTYRLLLRAVRSRGVKVAVWSWKANEEEALPLVDGLYDILIADNPARAAALLRGRLAPTPAFP